MRIVALINDTRLAPDTDETFEALAPNAQGALNWSLALANTDDEVIALTAGPAANDAILRDALDRGADRAIRVWVPPEDETTLDNNVRGISELLAATIRDLSNVDLILCGYRSTDWGTGITGPATAFVLDIPHLSQISEIVHAEDPFPSSEAPPENQRPREHRLIATQDRNDRSLRCEMRLPALLTIVEGPTVSPDRPRRPDATVELIHADEVGFEADDPLPWPSMPIEPAPHDPRLDDSPETLVDIPSKSGLPR